MLEENRIMEMKKELEGLVFKTRHGLEDNRKELGAFTKEMDQNKQRFGQILDGNAAQIKTLEKYRADINKAELQLKMVDKALENLNAEMEQIGRRSGKIEAIDARIQGIDTVVSDMEIRIEAIDKGREMINSAQKKIDILVDVIGKAEAHIESIVSRGKEIESVKSKVEDMEMVMDGVEKRMRELGKEKQIIKEAEIRINSLNLLMEDIKAQISNLSSEEHRIQDAIEKTSPNCASCSGEVDSKLTQFGRKRKNWRARNRRSDRRNVHGKRHVRPQRNIDESAAAFIKKIMEVNPKANPDAHRARLPLFVEPLTARTRHGNRANRFWPIPYRSRSFLRNKT